MAAQLRTEFAAHESADRANTIFGFARQLKRLADEHDLAVLCINQVSKRETQPSVVSWNNGYVP